jgi:hypothetical protein
MVGFGEKLIRNSRDSHSFVFSVTLSALYYNPWCMESCGPVNSS